MVTVTSTIPALPAGEVIVIDVAELTVRLVPLLEPNLTAVAPIKLVPVTVTVVPPDRGPTFGDIEVTVGTPS